MKNVPAWWNNKGEEQNRKSAEQERKRAKQIDGKVQAGSGSSWRAPEDVKNDEYLEQIKYTYNKSYPLKVYDWIALRKHAGQAGKEPRMVIDFVSSNLRLIITEEELPT